MPDNQYPQQQNPQVDPYSSNNNGYQQNPVYPPDQQSSDYASAPQTTYDANGYPTQPEYAADPNQNYNSTYQATDYNSQPQDYSNSYPQTPDQPQYDAVNASVNQYDQSYPASSQYDPSLEAPVQSQANTFEEKKGGNRLFFIISGVIISALLVAAGVLVYLNFFQNGNQTTTTASSSSSASVESSSSVRPVDNSKTGGNNTPASKARINNVPALPENWILQKMRPANPNAVDDNGKCVTTSFCGENADFDKDGATNIEEYNFGTDPLNVDTDADGISDGDELFVYFSDPNKKDTDADTFSDGDELASCYDMNTTAKEKMNSTRLSQISQSASLRKITEPTITTLKTKGKAAADVDSKGYSESSCAVVASSSSSASSVASSSSGAVSTSSASSVR